MPGPDFVQDADAVSTASDTTLSVGPITVTAGNSLFVFAGCETGHSPTVSVSGGGNTWFGPGFEFDDAYGHTVFFSCVNAAAGSTTVTVTWSVSVPYRAVYLMEFGPGVTAWDSSSYAFYDNADAASVTPAAAGAFLIAATWAQTVNSGGVANSVSAGFTLRRTGALSAYNYAVATLAQTLVAAVDPKFSYPTAGFPSSPHGLQGFNVIFLGSGGGFSPPAGSVALAGGASGPWAVQGRLLTPATP